MNVIICYTFDKNIPHYNTTGDYNFIHNAHNIANNFSFIGSTEYLTHINVSFKELEKYVGNKIKTVTFINNDTIYHNNIPLTIPIYLYIIDVHGATNMINSMTNHKLYNVISPYAYCYNSFNYKSPNNIYFLPHCITHKCKFNVSPKIKILISGRGRKNYKIYPMRYKFYNLHISDNRIEYLKPDHPYRIHDMKRFDTITCGQNYINKLNEYLICFCDDLCNDRPYIVCKFFEILSSGSLLLASNINTQPHFKELGLIDGEDYISINNDNIQSKINFIMNPLNLQLINKIRKSGYNKCNEFHNCNKRLTQLMNIIDQKNTLNLHISDNGTKYYSHYE